MTSNKRRESASEKKTYAWATRQQLPPSWMVNDNKISLNFFLKWKRKSALWLHLTERNEKAQTRNNCHNNKNNECLRAFFSKTNVIRVHEQDCTRNSNKRQADEERISWGLQLKPRFFFFVFFFTSRAQLHTAQHIRDSITEMSTSLHKRWRCSRERCMKRLQWQRLVYLCIEQSNAPQSHQRARHLCSREDVRGKKSQKYMLNYWCLHVLSSCRNCSSLLPPVLTPSFIMLHTGQGKYWSRVIRLPSSSTKALDVEFCPLARLVCTWHARVRKHVTWPNPQHEPKGGKRFNHSVPRVQTCSCEKLLFHEILNVTKGLRIPTPCTHCQYEN